MKRELTIQAFEQGLIRHGTRLREWPVEERERAESLLASSDEARALLDSERLLNATLDALPGLEPGPLLRNRVFEIPITHERRSDEKTWWWQTLVRVGLPFAAVMLCVGTLSGWLSTDDSFVAEQSDRASGDVTAGDLGADDVPSDDVTNQWEELAEVALADELVEEWP